MSATTGGSGATSGEPVRDPRPAPQPSLAYRERLWPAPWIWLAVALLAGFAAVITLPFGPAAGTLGGVVAFAAFSALLITWSPSVAVSDGELLAGRAHIPVALLGEVTLLDAGAMRRAAGPELDMRAYLCIRGWIATGVRAELNDPDDPTPYWLISTRRPQLLVDVLQRARRATRPAAG